MLLKAYKKHLVAKLQNPFHEHQRCSNFFKSTVHELSCTDGKSTRHGCDVSPGPLGEKRERYLCVFLLPYLHLFAARWYGYELLF